MTPFDQFKAFHGTAWSQKLLDYLNHGWVYSSETCFVLVSACVDDAPEDRFWFIDYLAGDVKEAIHHLPFYLPYIAFNRRNRPKIYATATITQKFLKDEHQHINESSKVSFNDILNAVTELKKLAKPARKIECGPDAMDVIKGLAAYTHKSYIAGVREFLGMDVVSREENGFRILA